MTKTILILGAFGFRENRLSGQTIKTRNIYDLIKKNQSEDNVISFDTQEIKYSKTKIFSLFRSLFSCDTIIYLPAYNNLKYFFPIVYTISRIKKVPIVYVVVGGWLADYLKNLPLHTRFLRKIHKILVQTHFLKERLNREYNFKNVEVLHNFRSNDFNPNFDYTNERLKLVFMARINKLKGLETIFSFAGLIKERNLNIDIDFYGPIVDTDNDYFGANVAKYDFVTYHGNLAPDRIYETLSKYDLLILPTQYYTEGFPGSVLDAYISGIPVIVTKWMYATEFVDEGITGFIVPFENPQEEFNERILDIYFHREKLKELKINAFKKSLDFSEEKAWEILEKVL